MKKFSITVDAIVSTGDLHYMEDFVSEYTDPSVIAQAVDGVPEDEIERAYSGLVSDTCCPLRLQFGSGFGSGDLGRL